MLSRWCRPGVEKLSGPVGNCQLYQWLARNPPPEPVAPPLTLVNEGCVASRLTFLVAVSMDRRLLSQVERYRVRTAVEEASLVEFFPAARKEPFQPNMFISEPRFKVSVSLSDSRIVCGDLAWDGQGT